jgi:hypothetical protein
LARHIQGPATRLIETRAPLMRRLWPVLVGAHASVALSTVFVPALARASNTADQLRAAAERIVAAHDLQGEMPGPPPPLPDWWLRFVRALRHAAQWLWHWLEALPPFRWLGRMLAWVWTVLAQITSPVGRLILLGLVIAIVIGAAFWIGDVVARRRRSPSAAQDAVAAAQGDARVPLIDEADALARQGRYAEAMHALLLLGLALIRRQWPQAIADSLTSREIVRSTELPAAARDALDDIVIRVELGHFGLYPVAPRDYEACRGHFALLVAAMPDPAP